MKGQSTIKPLQIIEFDGGYQFRYNIQFIDVPETETESELTGAKQSYYKFDFVNIKSLTRADLIDAIITDKYSYASQIGKAACTDEAERAEYSAFVDSVKALVDETLAVYE